MITDNNEDNAQFRDEKSYTIKSLADVDISKHQEHWFQTGVKVYNYTDPPIPFGEFDFVGQQGTKLIRFYTEKGAVPHNAKFIYACNYPDYNYGANLRVPILGGGLLAGYAFFKV